MSSPSGAQSRSEGGKEAVTPDLHSHHLGCEDVKRKNEFCPLEPRVQAKESRCLKPSSGGQEVGFPDTLGFS